MSCFPLKIMLPMPGLDSQFPKKEKGSSLFVMRPLIFSEILGCSLLSLRVHTALHVCNLRAVPIDYVAGHWAIFTPF